MFSVDYSLTEA